MERALVQLRAAGFHEALLWVHEDNPRARRFYERWWLAAGRSRGRCPGVRHPAWSQRFGYRIWRCLRRGCPSSHPQPILEVPSPVARWSRQVRPASRASSCGASTDVAARRPLGSSYGPPPGSLAAKIQRVLRGVSSLVFVLVSPYAEHRVDVAPALKDFVHNPHLPRVQVPTLTADARATTGRPREPSVLGESGNRRTQYTPRPGRSCASRRSRSRSTSPGWSSLDRGTGKRSWRVELRRFCDRRSSARPPA